MNSGARTLADWMKRRAVNNGETAALFGCDPSFITKLLEGSRTPGLELSVKIEALTGIPSKAWLSTVDDREPSGVSQSPAKLLQDKR